jgi:hypothetical protein
LGTRWIESLNMQLRRSDLADLSYFLEISKHRNFRRAAIELGIGASALSHALRSLEERLGVRLFHRTGRSVTQARRSNPRLLARSKRSAAP